MGASFVPAAHDVSPDVTGLLVAWGAGDQSALDRLIPLVHHELRRLARRQMRRERRAHTLQTTALVHEAWPAASPASSSECGGWKG
jgi:hypothetical protein